MTGRNSRRTVESPATRGRDRELNKLTLPRTADSKQTDMFTRTHTHTHTHIHTHHTHTHTDSLTHSLDH